LESWRHQLFKDAKTPPQLNKIFFIDASIVYALLAFSFIQAKLLLIE
jgi:hypothetical protein